MQIIKASPCVTVCACIRDECVRWGFLIDQFSNIIRMLLSEYQVVFCQSMHIRKVVTSGTSVKINVFLRSLFIHCAAAELTGIFSDIMNLKDCVRFSDSLVLQQHVKTRSEGYLGHGGEGIGVKELWL